MIAAATWRPAKPGETPGQLTRQLTRQLTPELNAQHALAEADQALGRLLDLRTAITGRVQTLDRLKARLLRDQPARPARGTVGHLDVTDETMWTLQ